MLHFCKHYEFVLAALILGIAVGSSPHRVAADSLEAAKPRRRHYLLRRFGLRRSRLLWASNHQDSKSGSHGEGRAEVDQLLCRRSDLHSQPSRVNDRAIADPQRDV